MIAGRGDEIPDSLSAPAVSVTMSAYNTAEFLEPCLDSIRRQSFRDFELIIVDDGSTDGTRDILIAHAALDDRIRLILKDSNEGLATARNECVDAARGRYITFIDTDDVAHPELLRHAVETADRQQADMVLWDYSVFFGASAGDRTSIPSGLAKLDVNDRAALLALPAFAWTRMVRTEALRSLAIRFPPKLTYQDIPVHWRLITGLDRIALIPERLVYYRQQPAATTSGKGWKRADLIPVLDQVSEYLRDSGLYEEYKDLFIMKQLNGFHGVYDVVAPEFKPEALRLIEARLGPPHWEYIGSQKPLRWQARSFYKGLRGDRLSTLRLGAWQLARRTYRAMKAVPRTPFPR